MYIKVSKLSDNDIHAFACSKRVSLIINKSMNKVVSYGITFKDIKLFERALMFYVDLPEFIKSSVGNRAISRQYLGNY